MSEITVSREKSESVSMMIVNCIAELVDCENDELDFALYDYINPESVNQITDSDNFTKLDIAVDNYSVSVSSDSITVRD